MTVRIQGASAARHAVLPVLGALLLLPAAAQEKPALPPEAEKIGENVYRVGKVTVDLNTRTATCSGKVNMRRGLIEYLAVAPGGKLHESALSLDVRPLHLQVGLILLGLEPKGGLRYQGDTQSPQGSPVRAWLSWRRAERPVKVALEELAWDVSRGRPMPAGAFVFTGSLVREGVFLADDELSLIASYRDPAAILNNMLPTGSDDTAYKVNERIAPAVGTPVTVSITPAEGVPAAAGGR